MDEATKEAVEAARDHVAAHLRHDFAEALATALRTGGKALWIGGAMIGPDRAEARSPFEFGSDAVVGLATVLQVAGELVGGSITLFEEGNRYAAAALTRQLVEVEYLAWAFEEDTEEAERWMRSSKEERQELWQPRHIRARAGNRFRGVDYGLHCGKGGHPSPEGIFLLPDHFAPDASGPLWHCDIVIHGHSVWRYSLGAAAKLGQEEALASLGEARVLCQIEREWREADPFVELIRRRTRPRGGLASILLGMRDKRERAEASTTGD